MHDGRCSRCLPILLHPLIKLSHAAHQSITAAEQFRYHIPTFSVTWFYHYSLARLKKSESFMHLGNPCTEEFLCIIGSFLLFHQAMRMLHQVTSHRRQGLMRGAAIFQSSNLNVVGIFTTYLTRLQRGLVYRPYAVWNIERNPLKYGSMRKLQLYSRGRRKDDNVGLGGRRCAVSRLENSEQLC